MRVRRHGAASGVIPVVTPLEFATELERVRAVVDWTARAVAAQAAVLTEPERTEWSAFIFRWGAFYNDHAAQGRTSPIQTPLGDVRSLVDGAIFDQARAFGTEALAWRARLAGRVQFEAPPPSGAAALATEAAREIGTPQKTPSFWRLVLAGVLFVPPVFLIVTFVRGLRSEAA